MADAAAAYQAIRLCQPGGIGAAPAEDVADQPTVTLRAAMALAADRDEIAREYATAFAITFGTGAPTLRDARDAGLGWEEAILETYLTLLAREPDTLIARKLGLAAASEVSRTAEAVLAAGGARTPAGLAAMAEFDANLRNAQNSRNPGTTADLTAAAIFAVLVEDARADDRLRTSRAQ